MSPRTRALLLILIGVLTAQAALAGEADKLLKRHRKAIGAKAASRISSTLLEGRVQGADGATGRYTLRLLRPDRIRVDLELGGVTVSECYNGKSAWRLDAEGLRTLLGADAKRLRLEGALANGHFEDLSRSGILVGPPQRVPGSEPAVVALDFVLGEARTTFFLDAATHRIVRQRRQRGQEIQELDLADYRPVDGLLEPHSIRLRQGDRDWTISVEKIVHGRDVAEADFGYPQVAGSRPLPELKPVLEAVEANQQKLEALREQYTCSVTEFERRQDKEGRIESSTTKVYEVTPIGSAFLERLVSIDGKPLDAERQAQEDRRVDRQAEKLHKIAEAKRAAAGKPAKEDRRGVEIGIPDFLRISHVTSVRRELFRGHEVLAFDFEPPPRFDPEGLAEKLVGMLAGTMWVDEEAQQIVRLEAHLTRSFKVGGGMVASMAPSTAFVFEQDKIGNELWLPSYLEMTVAAKYLLFGRIRLGMVRHYSDYQKFEVQSEVEVGTPEQ